MEASPNNTGIDAPQSARQTARRRCRSEEGVTLVELLTAIALLTTLLAIAMPTVVQGLRTEPKISERAAQIAKARALVERVARELRQGYAVDSASASALTFRTYTRHANCNDGASLPEDAGAVRCRVSYSCTAGACTRTETLPDGNGGGGPTQLVDGLMSTQVFSYLPNATAPRYVEVRFSFPAEGNEDAVTLDDGIGLRNTLGAS
jgi:type II secretory pathway pseudopilin PulG